MLSATTAESRLSMPPSSAKRQRGGSTAADLRERELRQVRRRQRVRDAAEARADGLDRQTQQRSRAADASGDGDQERRPVRPEAAQGEDGADRERRDRDGRGVDGRQARRQRLQLRQRSARLRCRRASGRADP